MAEQAAHAGFRLDDSRERLRTFNTVVRTNEAPEALVCDQDASENQRSSQECIEPSLELGSIARWVFSLGNGAFGFELRRNLVVDSASRFRSNPAGLRISLTVFAANPDIDSQSSR